MSLLRLVALATLCLVLTAFTLKQPEFEIEFPDGWEVGPKDKDGLITVRPPAGTDDGTNCNVYFVDRAEIKDTQTALNDQYRVPISVDAWHDFLSTKPDGASISNRVAVGAGKAVLQIATVDVTANKAKARIGFIVTPGRVFDAGCYVLQDKFDRYEATFDKIVRSLRAK